jgi:hypothetical protein
MHSRHLRVVGDPMLPIEVCPPDDDRLDSIHFWHREPLARPGICPPCQRSTTMGIRLLSAGSTSIVLPRCLRCWLAGVFMERGIAMRLVHTDNPEAPLPEYPPVPATAAAQV